MHNKNRWRVFWVIIGGLVLLFGGFLYLAWLGMVAPLMRPLSTEPYHVNWEGKEFWIPRNYFSALPEMYENKGANLEVLWPSMEPRTEQNQQTFDQDRKNNGLFITLNSVKGNYFAIPVHEYIYGKRLPKISLQSVGKYWGLTKYEAKSFGADESQLHVIYLNGTEKKVDEYIVCLDARIPAVTAKKLYVRCILNGYRNGIDYDIEMSPKLLPEWQAIRDRSYALMDSFAQPANKLP